MGRKDTLFTRVAHLEQGARHPWEPRHLRDPGAAPIISWIRLENGETTMSDLGPGPQGPSGQDDAAVAPSRDRETRQWAMFIHFSVLAGWAVPVAGIIVPILLWQMKKEELPGIVPHAHVVMNWILSSLLYALICMILMIVLVGMLGFIALAVLTVIYAVIGGIKANDGELWEYPGTIIKVFK